MATLSGGMTTFRAFHDIAPTGVDSTEPVISYTESAHEPAAHETAAQGSGVLVDLDCAGLACPGPIMKLQQTIAGLAPGDEVLAHVSDPGFRLDAPAWALKNGHEVVSMTPEGPGFAARIRKGGGHAPVGLAAAGRPTKDKKSLVVFSGDLDKVLAAFIIANGAVAMGEEVSMFFTFWGLNALRRQDPPKVRRAPMVRMMGALMPSGPGAMKLSTMNLLGGGTAMMKKIMKDNHVPSLPELIASAQAGGVRLVGCTMTMDLLGIAAEDLIDGVELGGVATFLGDASESNGTLFV